MDSTSVYCDDMLPIDCAIKARRLWLDRNPDLEKVEKLYRSAVESFLPLSADAENVSCKKRRLDEKVRDNDQFQLEEWQRLAVERLCMLLCQSGRASEAKPYLQRMGFTCRLASCVLNYPTSLEEEGQQKEESDDGQAKKDIPCGIWDNFLSLTEVKHLQRVFQNRSADYWISHKYEVEPPSPYFSYIIPLERIHRENGSSFANVDKKFGGLGEIISKVYNHLLPEYPKLSSATSVEMWAHNRPHPSGHQFHFDSDNEGQGKIIKNPIATAILYLSEASNQDINGVGGPSVITNQSIHSRYLATKACISLSQKMGRMVAFDGTMLHGVIPGKGVHSGTRRATVMLAFWRRIRVRKGDCPGAARPFPFGDKKDEDSWSKLLTLPLEKGESTNPIARNPIPLDRVYETLDGEKWTKAMGFPEYDHVYQGF